MALLDIRLSEISSIEQSVADDAQTSGNEFEGKQLVPKTLLAFLPLLHIPYEQSTRPKDANIKNA